MTNSVSVVIAARNAEHTIARAIRSIQEQEDVQVEIILVDDASTDQTTLVAESLRRSCDDLVILRNNTNLGAAGSRQVGIEASSADFVSTLDADDFYCDRLKLSAEFNAIKNSSGSIGFSGILIADADGNGIGARAPDDVPITSDNILSRSCFIPRDFLVARSMLRDVGGFDPDIDVYEDWDLKIRLATIAEFTYSGIVGVCYTQHGTGLSKRPDLSYWRKYVFLKNLDRIGDVKKRVELTERLNANSGVAVSPITVDRRHKVASNALRQFDFIAQSVLSAALIENAFLDEHFVLRNYGARVHVAERHSVDTFVEGMLKRGWDPNPLFNTQYYSLTYGLPRQTAVAHYIAHGWRIGNWPSASFDPAVFYAKHPTARYQRCNPITWLYRNAHSQMPREWMECRDADALSSHSSPMVSVVVINRDNAVGLQKTLHSCSKQVNAHCQVIVIDGGSSDGSLDVMSKFSQFVDFAISEPDQGIWDAQKKGLLASTGSWVIFMNAGDRFFYADSLASLVAQGSYADVVHGHAVEDGWYSPKKFQDFLYQGMPFSHQAFVARRELYDHVGFDANCGVADYRFLVDAYSCGAVFQAADVIVAALEPIGVSSGSFVRRALQRWDIVQRRLGSQFDSHFRDLIHDAIRGDKPI